MSGDTVYHYDAICIDELGNTITHDYWSPTYPTACPFGITGHTFQMAFTVNSVSQEARVIKDDISSTHGTYRGIGYDFNVGTGSTGIYQDIGVITFPYNVRVHGLMLSPTANNIGDYFSMVSARNTIIGALTADVSSGNILNVTPTVIAYMCVGYEITLQNGSTTQVLGECYSANATTNTITVQNAVTSLFPAGSNVMITLKRIENYKIVSDRPVIFGSHVVESSLNPAGVIGTIMYKNMNDNPKTLSLLLEIYY